MYLNLHFIVFRWTESRLLIQWQSRLIDERNEDEMQEKRNKMTYANRRYLR